MNLSSLFVILSTFLMIITIFVTKVESADEKKFMVCYLSSWATYRKPSFTPAEIDPTVCTHIVYAFAGLKKDTADSIVSLSAYTDFTDNYGLGYYSKVTGLKERYPHLKVLLSIGGWNEGSINYSKLAQSKDKRRSFVTSVIAHLSKYNFDGLDVYWQYPAKRGGIPEDKDNFPLLLRDLRDEFDKNDYLLTVFLSSTRTNIDAGYDLPAIAQMVDWINLHSFSFGTPWDKKFGISSPLESKSEYNVKVAVNYYLEHGVPNNKLVLIFSTHSYGYKDTDSPGKTDGISGLYTEDKGFLAFHEVCKYLQDDTSGWTETWDESSLTPVAVKKSCSCKISYDNQRSMTLKTADKKITSKMFQKIRKQLHSFTEDARNQVKNPAFRLLAKFAVEKNLKGLGVWTLDTDDYGGVCSLSGSDNTENGSKFPLVRALNQELRGQPTVVVVNENRMNEIDKSPDNIEVNVVVHSFN